jgi:hypothetical protein
MLRHRPLFSPCPSHVKASSRVFNAGNSRRALAGQLGFLTPIKELLDTPCRLLPVWPLSLVLRFIPPPTRLPKSGPPSPIR